MPKARKSPQPKPQQLLVEGKNDQHVIWALCKQHQLPETFSVEVPVEEDGQGIEVLLNGLPLRLREENLSTLGVVVDADRDLLGRWEAVRYRLKFSRYEDIPKTPPMEGWICASPELPRVGVWLMPSNQLPGVLEDFVAQLMPPDDALRPKAEVILQKIEQENLNCYTLVHRP